MLEHLLGKLQDSDPNYQDFGTLYAIDQSTWELSSELADYGYLYIPNKCKDKDTFCDFHAHFHGCLMSNQMVVDDKTDPPTLVEDLFVRKYGLLEYAAKNNIILLFPQNNEKRQFKG